ncbi:unnamed protein product [Ilex paraguariensis]|uniref:Transmembrane protein n=1 Tax=Ilex paraguariensis TaxID=185542 RepID=A0ABC8U039_9AQUA
MDQSCSDSVESYLLDSSRNTNTYCYDQFTVFLNMTRSQNKYEAPMPVIGLYVAAASLVCTLAMAADVIHGFRHKKLWFPCKFFTVNAASLTILAVAMKLPVDLTSAMEGYLDQLAKLISNVFMTTVMGNFLTSFASMDDNTIFMNITALGILGITIIVNIFIQLLTSLLHFQTTLEIFVIIFMFILFVTSCFSALTIPATKRSLELKYDELHKKIFNEELGEIGKLSVQNLKVVVKKYWVMAETSGPQFVMARSVICIASGAIFVLTTALTVRVSSITIKPGFEYYYHYWKHSSSYGWSIPLIVVIQIIGIIVGTVAPTFRWIIAISFKCSQKDGNSYLNEFKVEKYWIQRLVEWKERPLPLRIRGRKLRKLVQGTKNLILNCCIGIQIAIVVVSKAILLIPVIVISSFFSCCYYCKMLRKTLMSESGVSISPKISEPETDTKLDLSNYVIQFEGEGKLPNAILYNMCHGVNQVIQMGRRKQPKYLMELLWKCNNFQGVAEFDRVNIQGTHCEELPNCWTLPVVTITSIAIALPNINNQMVGQLLRSVREGLLLASLVEENLCSRVDLLNIKNTVDIVWVGVELYCKWMDQDLRKIAFNAKNSGKTLQSLADITEKIVMEFKRNMNGSLMENPLNWPVKVIAANSMNRISRTILMSYEESKNQTDEELFEQLSVMIADILGACLSNLPRLITAKCYSSAIEKREKSVRDAARLLGETKEIIKIIRQHELPSLSPDQLAYIDEWRALLQHKNPLTVTSSSNNVITSSGSGELHIGIE